MSQGKNRGQKALGLMQITAASHLYCHPHIRKYGQQTKSNIQVHLKKLEYHGKCISRATTHRHVQDMGYKCRIPSVKPLVNQTTSEASYLSEGEK